MIYTVTLNPCIDYVIGIDSIKTGALNRTNREEIFIGGKGINVSLVLKELGVRSVAMGFVAGFTGTEIEKRLKEVGIETDFVRLKDGNSRINVKILSEQETEINARGPEISEGDIKEFLDKLDTLKDGDVLVLSGSVPSSMPSDIYETILKSLGGKKIMTVADASGDLLKRTLKYKPFLIKPNNVELGELFGVKLKTADECEEYAKRLKEMGAVNVLVSLAGEGALLIDKDGEGHKIKAFGGKVINSVGAGDSMVAGFIAGMLKGDSSYALRLGAACGAATAFSEGIAKKEDIKKLFPEL